MSQKVDVRIPSPHIWKVFKEFVEDKYKDKRFVLGLEVERALESYLVEQGWGPYLDGIGDRPGETPSEGRHTQPAHTKRQMQLLQEFFKEYMSRPMKPVKRVSYPNLTSFIRRALKIKSKTATKEWIIFLKDMGWIRGKLPEKATRGQEGDNPNEIIFFINLEWDSLERALDGEPGSESVDSLLDDRELAVLGRGTKQ